MKRFLTIVALSLIVAAPAFADVAADSVKTIADHIEATGKANITQPAKLNERLRSVATAADDAATEQASEHKVTGGFRIQAYSGNNGRHSKGEAESRSANIGASFPEFATYVTFDSPYWRLKVGDFPTYEEAHAALTMLKAQFPNYAREMRLVRDRIKNNK